MTPLERLARSVLPRTVEVSGERPYRVRPATVAEAVVLLACLPGVIAGDEGDVRDFESTLQGWLPADLYASARSLPAAQRLEWAVGLLDHGVTDAAEEADGDASAEQLAEIEWDVLLHFYAERYHTSPAAVLQETSWALFTLGLLHLDRLRATAILDAADAASIPHAGKDGQRLLRGLVERAESPNRTQAVTPPERVRTNLEALKAAYGRRAASPPHRPELPCRSAISSSSTSSPTCRPSAGRRTASASSKSWPRRTGWRWRTPCARRRKTSPA